MLLIVSFTNLSVSTAYQPVIGRQDACDNISPQGRAFKSIANVEISEMKIFESVVLSRLTENPNILFSKDAPANNLFAKLKSAKPVDVGFEDMESLKFEKELSDPTIKDVFIIPGSIDGKLCYAQIFYYEDGSIKSEAYLEEEFSMYCKELVEEGKLTASEAERLQKNLSSYKVNRNSKKRFIDSSDEGVQIAAEFLSKIGSVKIKAAFKEMALNKNLVLSREPAFYADSIVVSEERDAAKRAESLLQGILARMGLYYGNFENAFSKFCEMYKEGAEESFDLNKVAPELIQLVYDAENSLGASNEGSIQFAFAAYNRMIDTSDIDIDSEDCQRTIRDIKNIFRQVAEYEIKKHNEAVARGEKKYTVDEDYMPGMDKSKIKIVPLSKGLLPTDIVVTEGIRGENSSFRLFKEIRINENFVKVMTKLAKIGIKGPEGEIYGWAKLTNPRTYLGELYTSIIYAVAIHTIRGHFPIDENGYAMFSPDEFLAQPERGGSHLYVNLLAMMYYWIVVVERHQYPKDRAKAFMDEYPQIFSSLTSKEKDDLASDLLRICYELRTRGVWNHLTEETVLTDMEGRDVDEIIKESPGLESNESLLTKAKLISMFQFLSLQKEALNASDISKRFGDPDFKSVDQCLETLAEIGAVSEDISEEGEMLYKAALMSDDKRIKVEEALEEVKDIDDLEYERSFKLARKKVYGLAEVRWAYSFLNSVGLGFFNKKEAQEEKKKIVLAIETDWIPKAQKILIQELLQEIRKLDKSGTIKIVTSDSKNLSEDLKGAISKENIPYKNVVILASQSTVEDGGLSWIKAINDTDEASAFLVGVNPMKLRDDSYIRLLEMLTMALRMSQGEMPLSSHSKIEVFMKNARLFTFIPMPEATPLDIETIKMLYRSQTEPIAAAA